MKGGVKIKGGGFGIVGFEVEGAESIPNGQILLEADHVEFTLVVKVAENCEKVPSGFWFLEGFFRMIVLYGIKPVN